MKKHAILGIAVAALVLAGCGTSPEGKAEYLDWVHAYSDHMPNLSDDELIDLGVNGACPAGKKDASAVGLEPFIMPLFEDPDMDADGALTIAYAAITHLCPEVRAEYSDPLPNPGDYLGPPE